MFLDLIWYQLLVSLVLFHFLLDFAIQGDFVAKFKARKVDGKPNDMWKWVLTAHAAAHTIPVWLLTGSLLLSSVMFITHFIIDDLKCNFKINFNQDQALHLVVILLISLIYIFIN